MILKGKSHIKLFNTLQREKEEY